MNKKEFAIFASALRTYFPKENILPNQEAMELWYEMLSDVPYDVASAGLKKWISTNKWSPSIADIREMASTVTDGEIPDWGSAWGEVIQAIRHYGTYRESEALRSLSPLCRKTVERIGFYNLCMSENETADRANFRMVYEQLAERNKKDSQIPYSLKQLIGTMQNLRLSENTSYQIEEKQE
ncbi:MAG TPA: replicative helicase loader/inhibitor [Paludibacteraceae bacterium]|nr:replicative helicase loader/inhibitor [Paludibacteraceae bacterium]